MGVVGLACVKERGWRRTPFIREVTRRVAKHNLLSTKDHEEHLLIREVTRRVAKNTFLSTKGHEGHLFVREVTRRVAKNTFLSSKGHEGHLFVREVTRRVAKDTSLSTKGHEGPRRTPSGNWMFLRECAGQPPIGFRQVSMSPSHIDCKCRGCDAGDDVMVGILRPPKSQYITGIGAVLYC